MAETRKDSTPFKDWMRALERTAAIARNPGAIFPRLVASLAERHQDKPAIIGEGEVLTYRDLAVRAGCYARWALAQGVAPGEVVCLLSHSCPDYLAIWLGITRVGGVVALLNPDVMGEALAHAIRSVGAQRVIASAELARSVLDLAERPAPGGAWTFGHDACGLPRADAEPESGPLPDEAAGPLLSDRALYIFTSGTTGLPKAAAVSHFRVMQWSHWFAGMMDVRPNDRMYDCLPLHHSVGGVVAPGATLVGGGAVVLRGRFSASRFWDDVVESECTLFQYIGELCRYLVNAPPHPRERDHSLRLCCGNGLRPDVWERFRQRFAIPRILEFYAATEGSFSLYNCEGEPGAIGRIPSFLAQRDPVALVRYDPEADAPARDARGFCIPCAPNQPGEALGRLAEGAAAPGGRFEGYTDRAASERKILRGVFAEGDAWFRTGDLMRRDERGFFYFVDRLGDTFRWKGENVSTTEVCGILCGGPGVLEAVVYGVRVPGADGRAGMAAVVPGSGFDPRALHRHCRDQLPAYARPLFLRVCHRIDATPTFKPRKQDLERDGFDPGVVPDPLYFNDAAAQAFVPVDAALHARLLSGALRL